MNVYENSNMKEKIESRDELTTRFLSPIAPDHVELNIGNATSDHPRLQISLRCDFFRHPTT